VLGGADDGDDEDVDGERELGEGVSEAGEGEDEDDELLYSGETGAAGAVAAEAAAVRSAGGEPSCIAATLSALVVVLIRTSGAGGGRSRCDVGTANGSKGLRGEADDVVVGVAGDVGVQTDGVGLPSLRSFCSGSWSPLLLLPSASFACCPGRRRARAGRGDVGVGLALRSSTMPGSSGGRLSTCAVTRNSREVS